MPAKPTTPQLPTFEIIFENRYVLKGELYPGLAPNTVGSFIHLANTGFYDGAVLLNAAEDTLLQIDQLTERPPYCIKGEMPLNDYPHKGRMTFGGLCMYHPNGCYATRSRFMVALHGRTHSLQLMAADYTFFGQVLEGMLLARLLSRNSWDPYTQKPVRHRIESIRVNTYGKEYPFQTIPVPENYP